MKITPTELQSIITALEKRFKNVSPIERAEFEAITILLGIYYNKVKSFVNEFNMMKK